MGGIQKKRRSETSSTPSKIGGSAAAHLIDIDVCTVRGIARYSSRKGTVLTLDDWRFFLKRMSKSRNGSEFRRFTMDRRIIHI